MPVSEPRDAARQRLVERILESGAVAVIRLKDPARLVPVVESLVEGGIYSVEVTMTIPDALDRIAMLDRELGDAIILGVGSVLDAPTALQAIEAGARYVVSPILNPDVFEAAHAAGAAAMPGCFTPTEIQRAHEAGADLIKVFPADVVGMPFFRAVLEPMPHLRMMPTGGVTLTNAGDWLRAGACAVGVGSALLDRAAIAEGRYGLLTDNARTLRRSLDSAREEMESESAS